MARPKKTEMNDKEQLVVETLAEGPKHLSELADMFMDEAKLHLEEHYTDWDESQIAIQANSFARNSLRYPIKLGLVVGPQHNEQLSKSKKGVLKRGTYKLTSKGARLYQKKTTKQKGKKEQPKVIPMVSQEEVMQPEATQTASEASA
jgi:hypothetical protein